MSVQRSFAQRKNNVVDLVPEMDTSGYWDGTYLLKVDPTNCSVFNVDLRGLDSDTTDRSDTVSAYGNVRDDNNVPVVYFVVIINPAIALAYPGLEFTINFNGYQDVNWNTCVDVYYDATLTDYSDVDILSPVGGFDGRDTQSITMKSNGIKFTLLAAGPFTWGSYYDA